MKTKALPIIAIIVASALLTPSLYSQTFTFSTIAGGSPGFLNSDFTNAEFLNPTSVAVDGHGNVYVADRGNNAIRAIQPLGTDWIVTTIAGGAQGSLNGTNTAAQFYQPSGITIDSASNLYVTDQYNSTIRKIVPSGTNWIVSTIAGSAGFPGSVDGTNANARFSDPAGICVDGSGNLFVADEVNNSIRKITPSGTNWIVTTIAGGVKGSSDGNNTSAQFSGPSGVAVDASGRIFVTDQFNNSIRLITPVSTNWVVTTIAGQTIAGRTDGTGTNALFNAPIGLTVDSSGNVYVADLFNSAIRKLVFSGGSWVVTTIAGGSSGALNGTGTNAQFNLPYGVTSDAFGDVFVADSQNNAIRLGLSSTSPAPTGAVQVKITPTNAVAAGGKWQMDGSGPAQTNGAIISGLVPGNHYVNFYTISGYTTPGAQTLAVTAHQTNTITVNYSTAIANKGSLQVAITPSSAVAAGGQWRVNGGAWQTNGAVVAGLTLGSNALTFNPVAGWTTPSNQTVTIANGLTTVASGNYVLQTGSLTVTLLPSAVASAGAKWNVDGGTFQTSGATLTGLLPGSHTLNFNTVLGWNGPSSQSVTITNNLTTTYTATYSQPGPTVVQIGGMTAAGGNFQFTLNGPPGSNCLVQVSTDLNTWSPLSTNTISAGGSLAVSDSAVATHRNRFYRAVLR